jgi:glutaredoxin
VRKFLDAFLGRGGGEPVPVRLYSRPGCHLCDVMKTELSRARLSRRFELEEVDIDRDDDLRRRFGHSIPVLEIGGRIAFKGRLTVPELERKFERLAGEWEGSRGAGAAGGAASDERERRG